ncbi:unnamed protein product [Tilletia controversa]|uniref:Uncharacterized protein n=3 Tax=Tilletia TaxID=13289 RepID=A0A8X7MR63_9BASI|nr:hypothetical protein CF328_g4200 [Tilletia controversa]KAE8196945.1 hypothetical protein CF336_g2393 [Tilletia laevis]KAE8261070.1 hypothetical protein A4X03_0g3570 [Tilletia caries]KAE8206390.1 hypothetical protein CF335_g1929 [Tilletia laevis]KAE8246335.1 hypothetical protein A4X06_0g5053 [Tilletia controversa]
MSKFFDKIHAKLDDIGKHGDDERETSTSDSMAPSRHGIPNFVMKHVDKYIEAMRPTLVPLLTHEIDRFQGKTIDSLEHHMSEAFKSIFEGKYTTFTSKVTSGLKTRDANDVYSSHEEPGVPQEYGERSIPFLDIPELTEDLKLDFDFDPLEHASPEARRALATEEAARSREWAAQRKEGDFFSIALQTVSKFAEATQGQMGLGSEVADSDGLPPAHGGPASDSTDKGFDLSDEIKGKFKELKSNFRNIAGEVAKARNNPEEKARAVAPDLKTQIADVLRRTHLPLAEQMISIAINQLKLWLRGHISTRELVGDAASSDMHEALSNLKSMFKHKAKIGNSSSSDAPLSRGLPPSEDSDDEAEQEARELDEVVRQRGSTEEAKAHGVAGVLSRKLSSSLVSVRTTTRNDFQKILSTLERTLFDLLPDALRGPLSKVFGGNPFDDAVERDASTKGSSFLKDLFDVREALRSLINKIQLALRRRVLEVIGGGHRLLEQLCWGHVQKTVVESVRKYVPNVHVDIEDEEAKANAAKVQQQQGGAEGGKPLPVPVHDGRPPASASGEAASYWSGELHSATPGDGGQRGVQGPGQGADMGRFADGGSKGPPDSGGQAASYYSGQHH